MDTISVFALFVAAFVGTVATIFDPMHSIYMASRGKTNAQLRKEGEELGKKGSLSELGYYGCAFGLFIVVSYFYGYVIQPLAVISALVNKTGNQYLAYAILVVVIISLLLNVKGSIEAAKIVRDARHKRSVLALDGNELLGEDPEDNELAIKAPLVLYLMKRYFLALPILYLWYLFLVTIDVLK